MSIPEVTASSPTAPPAHWGKRVLAAIIDWFVLAIPAFALAIPLAIPLIQAFIDQFEKFEEAGTGPPPEIVLPPELVAGWSVFGVIFSIVPIAYHIVLNGNRRGQTVGKMALRIQVRNETIGGPAGYGKATIRYVVQTALFMACFIPGMVDLLFPLWDDKRQTIHDKAAGTLVVDLSAAS